jgi:sterol desaturase/sphingolipid hydroxylase (fatty acid hydroxylase superfamily)
VDLTPELTRGAVLVALFAAVAFWEQSRPARIASAPAGRRWFVNLTLYGLCTGVTIALGLLRTAAPTASFLLIRSFPATALSVVAHFVIMLLALDFIYYFGHRALHRWGAGWRVHAVHHTDLDLDVSTTLRHHPAEVLFFAVVAGVLGTLLGATPAEIAAYGALAFAVQVVAHGNIALPAWLEWVIGRLFVTPSFHQLHHARDERECHANFGEVFAFWDRLFGTAVASPARAPGTFGVAQYLDPRYQALGPILLQPVTAAPKPAVEAV